MYNVYSEVRINQISLSNTTLQNRILDCSSILTVTLSALHERALFALQLNESTDVDSCLQLLVLTRYINYDSVNEEDLLYKCLPTTTDDKDVF